MDVADPMSQRLQSYQSISLAFSPTLNLACSVSHLAGMYYTGDTVKFDVTATTGEALELTYLSLPTDAVVVASTSGSRSLRFSSAGSRTILVKARSIATGALCQSGSILSDTVNISARITPLLTCTGYTDYNPSFTYDEFSAWAILSGGSGNKWVDTITLTRNGTPFYGYQGAWLDATSAQLEIERAGSYLIKFNLKDSAGNTGSCTTTQVVWD